MNCMQIEELLPLHAGRDLDEKRVRLVSEHLQICPACARVADEYQDAVELTQHFAPPVFTDMAYASVRRQVLRQIENEPKRWYARLRRASRPEACVPAPLLPQMFGSWFRPRMAWAVASVMIIALGFFALYLIVKRPADIQPVAENHPTVTKQPNSTATPPKTTEASPGTTQKREENNRRRRILVNRSPLVAAGSWRTAAISSKSGKDEDANSLPSVDATPDKTSLRVEMQTKDPNIRIIWFTQSNSKPALPNAKGT